METLSALLAAIPQPDVAGMARAQQHIDGLLKPPGSLAVWRRWRCSLPVCLACRGAGAGGESDCGHVRRPWRLA